MQHFKQRERSLIGEASLIGRKVKTSVFLAASQFDHAERGDLLKRLHGLWRWNEPWRSFVWSWAEGTGLPALLRSSHWIVSKPLLLSLGRNILSIFCRRKLMDFYSRSSWENEIRQHCVCWSYFSHGFNRCPTRRTREKGGFAVAHSSRSEAAKPQGPPSLIHFSQQGSTSKRFPNLPEQHHQLGTSSDA